MRREKTQETPCGRDLTHVNLRIPHVSCANLQAPEMLPPCQSWQCHQHSLCHRGKLLPAQPWHLHSSCLKVTGDSPSTPWGSSPFQQVRAFKLGRIDGSALHKNMVKLQQCV